MSEDGKIFGSFDSGGDGEGSSFFSFGKKKEKEKNLFETPRDSDSVPFVPPELPPQTQAAPAPSPVPASAQVPVNIPVKYDDSSIKEELKKLKSRLEEMDFRLKDEEEKKQKTESERERLLKKVTTLEKALWDFLNSEAIEKSERGAKERAGELEKRLALSMEKVQKEIALKTESFNSRIAVLLESFEKRISSEAEARSQGVERERERTETAFKSLVEELSNLSSVFSDNSSRMRKENEAVWKELTGLESGVESLSADKNKLFAGEALLSKKLEDLSREKDALKKEYSGLNDRVGDVETQKERIANNVKGLEEIRSLISVFENKVDLIMEKVTPLDRAKFEKAAREYESVINFMAEELETVKAELAFLRGRVGGLSQPGRGGGDPFFIEGAFAGGLNERDAALNKLMGHMAEIKRTLKGN